MDITLEKTLVDKLMLTRMMPKKSMKRKYDLSYCVKQVDDCENKFAVIFTVMIQNTAVFKMNIEYSAIFITDADITEEFIQSKFATINAPAIAYPFLRSYVSFVTLNSGYEPALLPTINFVEFSKENYK